MLNHPFNAKNNAELYKRMDEVDDISSSKALQPFLDSYLWVLSAALSEKDSEKEEGRFLLTLKNQEDFKTVACTMDLPKLSLHLFHCAVGGLDVAILEDKKTTAHILLFGEHLRGLNNDVSGFRLPFKKNPTEEVRDIIALWSEYLDGIVSHCSCLDEEELTREVRKAIAEDMKPVGADIGCIVKKYFDPVFGKGNVVPLSVSDVPVKESSRPNLKKEMPQQPRPGCGSGGK